MVSNGKGENATPDQTTHSLQKTPQSSQTNNQNTPKGHTSTSNGTKPPEHLSEFYSFMNTKSSIPLSPTPSSSSRKIPAASEDRKIQRQPSLNTFTSFSPSVLDLPSIVTSKDFLNNIKTYNKLLSLASKLRTTLLQVSEAANEFGQALEECITECPKSNNNKSVSDGLMNAGGLQYMLGSNQQILSNLIRTSFEEPLAKELARLQEEYTVNHGYYQQEVKRKSQALREKELENLKLSKQRTRNLNAYKNNLLNLTNQLEEIDRLKYDYYHEINLMIERFNLEQLLIKTGSLVRAQLEIFEGIARKGWSGGGLDELLEISPDLFEASYESDDVTTPDNDYDDRLGGLDKSASVSTLKQNLVTNHDVREGVKNIDKEVLEVVKVEDEDDYVEDNVTADTVRIDRSRLQTPRNEDQTSSISKPLASSKFSETEGGQDESFSLPVVHNSSLLGPKYKSSDAETSPESIANIDHHNILDELDN
ncbi:uncharacterized protein CANTADRAFT_7736 [Suhomyces tanzawaensis NRRL Y-17324]|uniref:IMD domain-containing protein n=1 Tax=Suhomyces tanzawaensis NRRL Y-17324 TaxID=984487 RepID=A0A1E4SCJ4_9ASCO|nr:uncharacterized protein CANTADRAFT_7736 [Suhomyces tanzawaensis NRRL Y-17324]ODV77247.1 hypothetical protein CANTADRAFT_7736 [Suhomyces tanzawaensis NRRL Y-17324]